MKATTDSSPRGPARSAAFTMIEMITVIVIIALLLAIAVPSIATIREQILWGRSKVTIDLLAGACMAYREDHRGAFSSADQEATAYPASTPAGGMEGRHLLVKYLTGYQGAGLDGNDGFGWRFPGGKLVHGPYLNTESMETKADGGHRVFVDSFGNAVLYYRRQPSGNAFRETHNENFSGRPQTNYFKDPGGSFYTAPFALITAGPDAQFRPLSQTDKTSDDVTNIFPD